jgi:three-Cys-motif partner protein
MAKPRDTLWDLEDHSRAKHEILRSYLNAWLPIMSKFNDRLVLVDGFAGPGRYKGGEDGSPIIMLKAFLEHSARSRMDSELVYIFIDEDASRIEHLEGEIADLGKQPEQVKWQAITGRFEDVFRELIEDIGPGKTLAPTFAFIDPFGYSDAPMDLSANIVQFGRCEVLVYVPFPFVTRFLEIPEQERALTSLFGSKDWKKAIGLSGKERTAFLRDLFQRRLADEGGIDYVRSFEIVTKNGRGGYDLFFATGHETGLDAMKTAMWGVDRKEGRRFRDSTDSAQQVLLEDEPDFDQLDAAIREHFGSDAFMIEEAEQFTLVGTPFLPTHLRKGCLIPAEKGGELEIVSSPRKKRNAYPDKTKMRFANVEA